MADKNRIVVNCGLISVSDKNGLLAFSQFLYKKQIQLIATGQTAALLNDNAILVKEVADYTGFPEILGGRVKTLHPKIHGGILARRNSDMPALNQHGITAIDIVIVNLYPFAQVISHANCNLEQAIENIDIGGVTLIRAAAKNFQDVAIIVDPLDYPLIQQEIDAEGGISYQTRQSLAQKAFAHVAAYDIAISNYFNQLDQSNLFPQQLHLTFRKKEVLRYGENPQQRACFYVTDDKLTGGTIAGAKQWQGKALSYNNIQDSDAALQCVLAFQEQATCVIVKHTNPCAVAVGKNASDAYLRAFSGDRSAAFGGIIAFNCELQADDIQQLLKQQFFEIVLAPSFTPEALALLQAKPAIRVLSYQAKPNALVPRFEFKSIAGGLLMQDADALGNNSNDSIVTKRAPSANELLDLEFAWKVAHFVKSNAIVIAKDQMTLGIGAGQMSRVMSMRIAIQKAEEENHSLTNAVIASDAFFPFRDSIELAASKGISAVIEPGGSIRDEEVIQAADTNNMAMLFTGIRHFRH